VKVPFAEISQLACAACVGSGSGGDGRRQVQQQMSEGEGERAGEREMCEMLRGEFQLAVGNSTCASERGRYGGRWEGEAASKEREIAAYQC